MGGPRTQPKLDVFVCTVKYSLRPSRFPLTLHAVFVTHVAAVVYNTNMGRSIRTNLQALVVQDDWAPNTKVNVQKQRSAFPPNFVHSLDSTHMLLTAKACSENGMWRGS